MKTNLPSVNKMLKKFDAELKALLLSDLKVSKVNIKPANNISFASQNKLRFS
ncbi:hypothetical protein [Mucilaginibacter sp.]|uniref:hypothetical protein n=1 Tax=Mucilaginibacter sp. TaxID=1882438 RepID=UPI003AFFCEAC